MLAIDAKPLNESADSGVKVQIMTPLTFRRATKADLAELVGMLADDALGATREDASLPLDQAYISAFEAICADENNELMVVESAEELVGMLQLTFIPYLTYTGRWRCLVEGVRIHQQYRGQGLGRALLEWAIERAKQRKCVLVQLTSDKQRPDAIRFYQDLGFVASHEGFKLKLGG